MSHLRKVLCKTRVQFVVNLDSLKLGLQHSFFFLRALHRIDSDAHNTVQRASVARLGITIRHHLLSQMGFVATPTKLPHVLRRQGPLLSARVRPQAQWRTGRCIIVCNSPSYVVIEDDDDDAFAPQEFGQAKPVATTESVLGPDPPFIEECDTCKNSGFVPCGTCGGDGYVKNPRSINVFYCPDCVGHKKLRCPACGGKCYMCE